jgi:hypothetical protein
MNTKSIEQTYLEGVLLLRMWLDKAILEHDEVGQEIYKRLFDSAIEQYHRKFGEK